MPRPKKQAPNRADGRFQYNLTIGHGPDGKRIRKTFYSAKSVADAKSKAEEWKVNQQVSLITGSDVSGAQIDFALWANYCLKSVQGTVKDSTYFNTYHNYMTKHVIPYFGNMVLSDVQPRHIEEFFRIKNKKYATDSQHKMLRCLNLVFSKGVENHKCFFNPCANTKIAKKPPAKKEVYTQEQADLVMAYTYIHPNGFSVRLLLRYGLSRSELLAIVPSCDYNPENATLRISSGLTVVKQIETGKCALVVDSPKTEYRTRLVPLHPDDAAIFDTLAKTSGFAFATSKGTPISPANWYNRVFAPFMHDMHDYYMQQSPAIDVPILHPHELRHTRASLWVNDNKNLYAIAETMGWGNLDMLRKRYAHPDIDKLRKNLDL